MKSANSFGHLFQVTTFGESHGSALGVVIDGCPSEVDFDFDFLEKTMSRRRPGNFGGKSGHLVSQRKEKDQVEVLSGVFQEKTLGTPIAMIVRNKDQRSEDYKDIALKPRPGHADDVWQKKFGHVDPRGGGRSSGRETVARVMAGAVAEMFLKQVSSIHITGFAVQIGPFKLSSQPENLDRKTVDNHIARFPDSHQESQIETLLKEAQEKGLSYGGKVGISVKGVPEGLGQPVFHKLKADLAAAYLSVGATSAFELGLGFEVANVQGTEFHSGPETVYGGVRGGLSTGENIHLSLSIKPTSSVLDVAKKGRHDPCIVVRAIPVIEAMTALVFADHILLRRLDRTIF